MSLTNTAWVLARLCKSQKGCTPLAAASDKVYHLLVHGRWFYPGTSASSTTKTVRHDIAEILLKVTLNTKKNQKKKLAWNKNCFPFASTWIVLGFMMESVLLFLVYFSVLCILFCGRGLVVACHWKSNVIYNLSYIYNILGRW